MMQEINECKYCSNTKFNHHSTAKYWEDIKLNFVECENCGLIFTNPMPDLSIVEKGNRAFSILNSSRGTISQYRGGKEYVLTLKNKSKSGNFLDIGCAEGIFLRGIEENSDWKAEGVEIVSDLVNFANDVLKIKVHQGILESMQNRENYFDHIRMNNVIEHIQDPVSFLKKSNQILKNGGTIYCSTPNGVQDGAVLKTANKLGFEINLMENHFFYYPPKTLKEIFRSCGFKITHAYSEDISHSLRDFGITKSLKPQPQNEKFCLSFYDDKVTYNEPLSINEINALKNHPSVKKWKLLVKKYKREIFRFRFPASIPLGHQQHIYAKKINELK